MASNIAMERDIFSVTRFALHSKYAPHGGRWADVKASLFSWGSGTA